MGNLPHGRVTPARPFLRTDVDYVSPIHIRTSKGRGQRSHKAFIAILVCLISKAVLEMVSDYSSESFLAAFRRFTSRRDLYEKLFSDCGTNFIGADKALREMFRASSSDGHQIAHAAASEGMELQPSCNLALWRTLRSGCQVHQAPPPANHWRNHAHLRGNEHFRRSGRSMPQLAPTASTVR